MRHNGKRNNPRRWKSYRACLRKQGGVNRATEKLYRIVRGHHMLWTAQAAAGLPDTETRKNPKALRGWRARVCLRFLMAAMHPEEPTP